jgi:hypothetical protein
MKSDRSTVTRYANSLKMELKLEKTERPHALVAYMELRLQFIARSVGSVTQ